MAGSKPNSRLLRFSHGLLCRSASAIDVATTVIFLILVSLTLYFVYCALQQSSEQAESALNYLRSFPHKGFLVILITRFLIRSLYDCVGGSALISHESYPTFLGTCYAVLLNTLTYFGAIASVLAMFLIFIVFDYEVGISLARLTAGFLCYVLPLLLIACTAMIISELAREARSFMSDRSEREEQMIDEELPRNFCLYTTVLVFAFVCYAGVLTAIARYGPLLCFFPQAPNGPIWEIWKPAFAFFVAAILWAPCFCHKQLLVVVIPSVLLGGAFSLFFYFWHGPLCALSSSVGAGCEILPLGVLLICLCCGVSFIAWCLYRGPLRNACRYRRTMLEDLRDLPLDREEEQRRDEYFRKKDRQRQDDVVYKKFERPEYPARYAAATGIFCFFLPVITMWVTFINKAFLINKKYQAAQQDGGLTDYLLSCKPPWHVSSAVIACNCAGVLLLIAFISALLIGVFARNVFPLTDEEEERLRLQELRNRHWTGNTRSEPSSSSGSDLFGSSSYEEGRPHDDGNRSGGGP